MRETAASDTRFAIIEQDLCADCGKRHAYRIVRTEDIALPLCLICTDRRNA